LTSVYCAGTHFKSRLSSGVPNCRQPERLLFGVLFKREMLKRHAPSPFAVNGFFEETGVFTVIQLSFFSNSFTKRSLLLGPTGPRIIHRPHTGKRCVDLRSVTSPLVLLHPGSE